MGFLRATAATLVTALAAGVLASAPAAADVVVVADPTAQNLTSYARTSAWSRRADDGSYRLVVRRGDGVAADAAARPSSVPFDPDLGPTIGTGLVVVYSRCAAGSRRRGCDIYSYNLGARVERRVARVSRPGASEFAPSQFRGEFAFARSGPRGGLFVRRHHKPSRRIQAGRFDETDLSATRVIARGHAGANTFVLVAGFDGGARIVRKGRVDDHAPTVVTSPVLAPHRAFWLQKGPTMDPNARAIVETASVGAAKPIVDHSDVPMLAGVDAIGLGSDSVPRLYSSPSGISLIDPPLAFSR